MFGIGAQELLVIAVVALLIVGPKKLPEMARSLGKGIKEFKRTAEGVTDEIKGTFEEEEKQPNNEQENKEEPPNLKQVQQTSSNDTILEGMLPEEEPLEEAKPFKI